MPKLAILTHPTPFPLQDITDNSLMACENH
jgi:hypothetical protein